MNNLKILPENNTLNYVGLIFLISIFIRVILCIFKVCAIRQGEGGEEFRNITRRRSFLISFLSWGHSKDTDDYWLPFIIGLSELFIYPALMKEDKWIFIGTWIGLKTASTWGPWQRSRTPYNRFLFGNILALVSSYLLFKLFL